MLSDLLGTINNWFEDEKIIGDFVITDGTLKIDDAVEGQYVRICGSKFNDGVYIYPLESLTDETFSGAVWLLKVPKEVLELNDDIDTWKIKNQKQLESPYQSESFGGYSYTLKSGSDSEGYNWQSQFRNEIKRWRKL